MKLKRLFLCILFAATACYPFDRITNYSSIITVSSILPDSRVVWLATSGGIFTYDRATGKTAGVGAFAKLPDVNCTALQKDRDGSLWIGTRYGFLYHYYPGSGLVTSFDSYSGAGWDIKQIELFAGNLLITSTKGISVFSPAKSVAVKNAIRFGDLPPCNVNTIALHNDSLYVGCDTGMASLSIAGTRLDSANFNDQTIWTTDTTVRPVRSFVNLNNTFTAYRNYAAATAGNVLQTDSISLIYNGAAAGVLPSALTALAPDGPNYWLGTSADYCFRFNGTVLEQIGLAGQGMTFSFTDRSFVDREGQVWLLSEISPSNLRPWQGINRYDGSSWTLLNQLTPGFGAMGGTELFRGILEDRNGNMWFGTPFGDLKVYERQTAAFSEYVIGQNDYASFVRVPGGGFLPGGGKCDALAQDSSGYIWIAEYAGSSGCLICYDAAYSDPLPDHFRRFFPQNGSPSYFMINIFAINIDRNNRIFVGSDDKNNGRLVIATYTGSPLQNGISILHDFNGYGTIWGMTTLGDGSTYIATNKGLLRFSDAADTLQAFPKLTAGYTCVQAEDSNTLWIGTASSGIIRYDIALDKLDYLTTDQGLISNNIRDCSLDRKNGYLWVATDRGASRYYLGHHFIPLASDRGVIAYPNPFSLSNPRHTEIVFENGTADTKVSIYTGNGTLCGQAKPLIATPYQWTGSWKVPKKISPGTYFYSAYSPTAKGKTGKIMILP
ncbi:MAG: two-component regulator propeller domain-containing protein [Chitinivibrionales bacterium]|nr:two-component regulator propeller domain-containing protein [Chitinivibrionales bacterium]